MSKSAIYTAMNTATAVAVGGTIPLGTTIRRFGCNIAQVGNGITLAGRGYYLVNVSVTAAPTAVGTVTATLFADGVAVPGATASGAVSTAGNSVDLSFPAIVRNNCDCDSATLTLVLTGAAATVSNVAVAVVKL